MMPKHWIEENGDGLGSLEVQTDRLAFVALFGEPDRGIVGRSVKV